MTKPAADDRIKLLREFMERRGLKPHRWATKAGIRSSTLYNFLAGKSASLSGPTLAALARAADATVDEVMGIERPSATPQRPPDPRSVPVRFTVGISGRLFAVDETRSVNEPAGVPAGTRLFAAVVEGDGLFPIGDGWTVFFAAEEADPARLVGRLAAVRVAGRREPIIREIRRGSRAGLWTLGAWNAAAIEDVEIISAHAVVSLVQPK